MINKVQQRQIITAHFNMLRQGEEKGLSFFYRRFFPALMKRTANSVHDECAAGSIVQEAFLRLWILRKKLDKADDTLPFLQTQISAAIKSFYSKTQNRFHRSLLRLDDFENSNEHVHRYDLEEDNNSDNRHVEQLDKKNMEKVKALLPHLPKEQQLIIGFCVKYSFNYERIAYYLGGISDYEVCMKVDRAIGLLKTILHSNSTIAPANKRINITTQGQFDKTQADIFRMRYELQLSFEEISHALKLNIKVVKRLFVTAYAQIKKSKQTA